MALEWVVLGYAAAAEAIMVLLLTIPGLDALRKGLVAVTKNLLKPFLSVVPFCLFLLMDIYWKYETRPSCEGDSCTPSEHLRHQKSIMKSQRNALLIAAALLFYWLLYSVTNLVVRIDLLNQRLERLKRTEWIAKFLSNLCLLLVFWCCYYLSKSQLTITIHFTFFIM